MGFEDQLGEGFAPLELAPLAEWPLVSVLLTNFNYGNFVAAAVESVLRQTYEHIELIVCDDGSTDDSPALLRSLAKSDERITLIEKENGGQASALNLAYPRASGNIICWLDADDALLPTMVERVVELFSSEACGAVVGPLLVVDSSLSPLQRLPVGHGLESGWIADRVVARGGRWGVVAGGGISLRREVADPIFPIPSNSRSVVADQFLYRLAPLLVPVGSLRDPLYLYRTHDSNAGLVKKLEPAFVRERLVAVQRTTEAVNERLRVLGLERRTLDVSRNVALKEQELYLSLSGNSATWRAQTRDYLTMAKMLARDDLYGLARRSGLIALYGIALFLPSRLRPGFISHTRFLTYGHGYKLGKALRSRRMVRRGAGRRRRSGNPRG